MLGHHPDPPSVLPIVLSPDMAPGWGVLSALKVTPPSSGELCRQYWKLWESRGMSRQVSLGMVQDHCREPSPLQRPLWAQPSALVELALHPASFSAQSYFFCFLPTGVHARALPSKPAHLSQGLLLETQPASIKHTRELCSKEEGEVPLSDGSRNAGIVAELTVGLRVSVAVMSVIRGGWLPW